MDRAKDRRLVDQGEVLFDLAGRQQVRVESPGAGIAVLAVQVLPAGLGRRNLEAAGRPVDGRIAVLVHFQERLDRPLGQLRDGAGGVVLEDAARCMRGRATGAEHVAAIDHDDIGDAPLRQFVRGGDADDPGADDHDAGVGWQISNDVARRVHSGPRRYGGGFVCAF